MWRLLFLFVVILSFIIGLALGVGALLHWWFPTIDFGIATLISVVAVAASTGFVARLTWQLGEIQQDEDLADLLWEARRPFRNEIMPTESKRPRRRSRKAPD